MLHLEQRPLLNVVLYLFIERDVGRGWSTNIAFRATADDSECRPLPRLIEGDTGHLLNPVLVVGHPHVDPGQVGVGTLDTMAHGAHQHPPAHKLIRFHGGLNPNHYCRGPILPTFFAKLNSHGVVGQCLLTDALQLWKHALLIRWYQGIILCFLWLDFGF